jgi:hypothetical protein
MAIGRTSDLTTRTGLARPAFDRTDAGMRPMTYEIRYFFDPGSGICLWAKNAAAREKLGYPIDHRNLDLSENTKRWLEHLVAWFDTSLDWESPPGPPWPEEERARFRQAARKGIELLRAELPSPQWEFFDEIKI